MESIFKQHRNGLIALAAAAVLAACAFGIISDTGSDDAQAETQQTDSDSSGSVFLAECDSDSQTDDAYEYAAVVLAIAILSIVIGLLCCRKQD